MQDNGMKSKIEEARQCHTVLIGQWLEWVRWHIAKPHDAATLMELKALREELESRKKAAEPPRFPGASAGDFG